MKIMNEIKRKRKGIQAGMIVGLAVALYMKFSGALTTQAALGDGLIDKMITLPTIDMAFVKIAIVATILGGLIGYIIQDKFVK